MSRHAVSFDVSNAVDSGETISQTAWVFLPADPSDAPAVLVCLAGGTYDKQYWHLDIAGHPGYSAAEHWAGQGFIVVALDHLGVGESSDPSHSVPVGLDLLANGDLAAVLQLRDRLSAGTLVQSLAPMDVPFVGVGHSMGACLTSMIQERGHVYSAVALLGYGVQVTNVHEGLVDASELDQRIAQSEAVFRQQVGVPSEAVSAIVPRELLAPMFYAGEVPAAVIKADTSAQSRVPVRAASEVTTPGFVESYARAIDVPTLLAFGGSIDVSPDPWSEPQNYRSAADVTLFIVPQSGHCHNFGSARAQLWDRLGRWVVSVL